MTGEGLQSPAVLVIDGDDSVRRLIAVVLEHAGFRTCAVDGLANAVVLLEQFEYAAIVRDLDLAPANPDGPVAQLLSATPRLLRRMVITTTAPARALEMIGPDRVFAVLGKPFDLQELVDAVTRCAEESHDGEGPGGGRAEPVVKLESLRRFVGNLPSLRRVLSAPVSCPREAVLRAGMRRTVAELSAAFGHAAQQEANRTRAAILRAASAAAARVAAYAPRDERFLHDH